jgi:hypothetical protein
MTNDKCIVCNILAGKLERDHPGDLDIDGRILLESFFPDPI